LPGELSPTEAFHRLYYESHVWKDTHWLGVPTQKLPLDLWIYQEILHETRPDLVIETGTARGGSALFLASILDLLGAGEIVTIDVLPAEGRPSHERITYLTGSSTSEAVLDEVRELAAGREHVTVILDSDHARDHVLEELRQYGPLVSRGCYLVVEDTNVNRNPVRPDHGPGPMEAVEEFLQETDDFTVDRGREKFLMTFNPKGYLRRRG
jgi:cephalosporin hydroxylase